MDVAPPLVRIVAAGLAEGLTGVLVGAAADVLVFTAVDDLRLSGTAGRVQVVGLAVQTLLWAVGFLVARPRQLREFGSAVTVHDLSVLGQAEERTRQLRRGCVRVAVFVILATAAGVFLIHLPLFGLTVQLMLLLGLIHTWRTAVWWERRHGVRLWKPALSAVGREKFRASPYYATAAGAEDRRTCSA
ncbi:hypothetical protein ACIBJF_04505 [Streptomyces sp. NPDC050743]|uniref:hypothetical protein n=1 Tax=Streptomyces sp. NPDC050743 TaxID=3365634 RepID=UPI003792676D